MINDTGYYVEIIHFGDTVPIIIKNKIERINLREDLDKYKNSDDILGFRYIFCNEKKEVIPLSGFIYNGVRILQSKVNEDLRVCDACNRIKFQQELSLTNNDKNGDICRSYQGSLFKMNDGDFTREEILGFLEESVFYREIQDYLEKFIGKNVTIKSFISEDQNGKIITGTNIGTMQDLDLLFLFLNNIEIPIADDNYGCIYHIDGADQSYCNPFFPFNKHISTANAIEILLGGTKELKYNPKRRLLERKKRNKQ